MSNNKTTFWKFLTENKIEIPIIQRDYAQGRLGKENLRKFFLADLKKTLDIDSDKPLVLDFVYGSTENGNLNPLDGQQRLTTLWLLHWYIALRAGELNEENCKIFRNFTYETRISSREFCQNLCTHEYFKNFDDKNIVDFITKQTWFYSAWKQDPTIQAMLRMLGGTRITDEDGLEKLFSNTGKEEYCKYWENLISEKAPIVFYHLPLKDFGLSDDLYIKMNARGKQLTSFENFKADLIGYITNKTENAKDENERESWKKLLDPTDGIPIRLDTIWTDIFWKNRSKGINDKDGKISKSNQIDEIYFAFLNRFFWNELFIAEDSDNKYILDIGKGDESSTQENNNASYYYLNNSAHNDDNTIAYEGLDVYKYYNGKIPLEFFQKLKRVLDNYSTYLQGKDLPECSWDTSFKFIPEYAEKNDNNIEITNKANDKILRVSTLNQVQRIVFFAVCKYFDHDDKFSDDRVSLQQWMRVIWNLVSGEDQNGRPEIRSSSALRAAIKFIDSLKSHKVYESLRDYDVNTLGDSSFDERCKEEIAKAQQILNENNANNESLDLRKYNGSCKKEDETDYQTWEEIIIKAESYAFFKGSIRFLFKNGKGEVNEKSWGDFDEKWKNIKLLIPVDKTNRHTIRQMIPFLNDNDIRNIFSKRNLSNSDNNLRVLLLTFPTKVHSFLMEQDKTLELSLLQNHLISLCEKHPNYWIHIKWVEQMDILSNYSIRNGYYEYESYVVGNDFFKNRLELLKTLKNIDIKETEVWKGLFINFNFGKYVFFWRLNDSIDMYDNQMNKLSRKKIYLDCIDKEKDASALEEVLKQLINEYETELSTWR